MNIDYPLPPHRKEIKSMGEMNPAHLIIGVVAYSRYSVCGAFGCRIVHGTIPVSDLASLAQGYGAGAVHDFEVARALNATLVLGEPEAMAELRRALGMEPPT